VKPPYFHLLMACLILSVLPVACPAQVLQPDAAIRYYLIHTSGNVVGANTDGRATIQELAGDNKQLLQFVPDGTGYYWIKLTGQQKYMALSGSWNTYFVNDSTTDASKYAIEKVSGSFVKLICKSNGKYLGTDNTTAGSYVFSDKSGTDSKHYWYISEHAGTIPMDTLRYLINPAATFKKPFDGWGISLCWWANMCGKWNDTKIDQIVDWLVSPAGLNYRIFRYNIGGGDDPLNRNCTPHHMANGKGLRAEMEGFKDSSNAAYNWSRDAAQRKIMLKIKEKRPDAIFEAFSNSCPYYMTYSGCCAGNVNASDDNLKPAYYEAFAHYLVDVCQFYKDSFNIEFKTLEPFNEPVTNYWGANGGQEGCHVSTSAQIAFLKVLSPILKASGLKTVISASDETSVSQSVTDFKAYVSDGTALDAVGQWNTHTYTVSNQARANIRALSTAYNKPLWMSEVGSGGSGIGGNLDLAQKLMNDIRYIRPEAWVDWQYVEEGNDQWCFLTGDFSAQTYQRVKNYYVRQQFSRYIHPGSTFITVPNDQMLAALSPAGDSLIIVTLNNSALKVNHQIDLSLFNLAGATIAATRTSETENNAPISDYTMQDSSLSIVLPGYSITTFVLPVTVSASASNELKTNVPYLVLSRTASLVMQSTDNTVAINSYQYGDSTQLWKLFPSGNGYLIENLSGKVLTDAGSYYAAVSAPGTSGQTFQLQNIGDDCYKVLSTASGKSLDLEGGNNTAGTKIGLYDYGSNPDASHRQWLFVLPPVSKNQATGIASASIGSTPLRMAGTDGALLLLQIPGLATQITVYSLTGIRILQQTLTGTFTSIPLQKGCYLVRYQTDVQSQAKTVKVMVH